MDNIKISKIETKDIDTIIEICMSIFSDVYPPEDTKNYLLENTNFNISLKATIDDKIIGCYLFNEDSICEFLEGDEKIFDALSNKKGLQGLALAVLPEYRGLGIGKELRSKPLLMPYRFIWGQHLKGLHNVDNWVKFGRSVIAETEEVYVTAMDLTHKVEISNIEISEFNEVLDICGKCFSHVTSSYSAISYLRGSTDLSISLKITLDDKIVGCYLFNQASVVRYLGVVDSMKEGLLKYINKRGLQGLGLAVLPEYRGLGLGKQLREASLHMGFDYVWGNALAGLNNIEDWVKFGRKIVKGGGDKPSMYTTFMDLSQYNNFDVEIGLDEYEEWNDEKFENVRTFIKEQSNNRSPERKGKNEELSQKYKRQDMRANIEYVGQPNGITCGPTSLFMVAKSLGLNTSIQELTEVCEVDALTGTTDIRMIKGLEFLKLDWEQFPKGDKKINFDLLNESLDAGYTILLRTFIGGKHWIVCNGVYDGKYSIVDPARGMYLMNIDRVDEVWGARDYDGFIVKGLK